MSRSFSRTKEKLDAPEAVKSLPCQPPRLLRPSAASVEGVIALAFFVRGAGEFFFLSKKGFLGPSSEDASG